VVRGKLDLGKVHKRGYLGGALIRQGLSLCVSFRDSTHVEPEKFLCDSEGMNKLFVGQAPMN